mmetsp:Transcript_28037/g.84294  ORF Transcript_28037/g.84294 Transcript_28037/m.84294 type:complete len:246 (+) Transcript_28037:1031-1768(+)
MLDDPPVRHLRPHNRVRDAGARSRAGRAAGAQTGAGGRAHRPIDRGHCLARRPSAVLAAAVRERVDGPSPRERRACRPGHLRPGHAGPDWACQCRLKDWECRPGIIKFTMWQTGCVRGRRGPCRWSTVVALPVGRTWWCSVSVERTDVMRDYAASSVTRRCCCSRSADMAAPPTTAPLAGRWARIPSRRRRPVTDEPARVSRGGAQSRHLAPATFFVAPVSEMTFGGRSRSGPLAPNRRWSRMAP